MNEIEKLQARIAQVKIIAEKLYEIEHNCDDRPVKREIKSAREYLDLSANRLQNAVSLVAGDSDE